MRVLQVISGMMYGGGQRVAEDLLEEADARDGIEMELCLLGDRAIDRFHRPGRVVPYSGRYNRLSVLGRTALALRKVFAQERPAVVHSHGWDADISCALALQGTRVVHVPHQHLSLPRRSGLGGAVRKALTRMAFGRRGTHLVAVSNAVADYVSDTIPWQRGAFHVILNGIDTGRFARRHERTAGGRMVLGCAARLAPMKGINHLIGAIRSLPATVPVTVRIAGTGEMERELRSMAAGLEDRLRFEGHVSDMPSFYDEIDALVLPSVSHEGLPLTLLEAMATGIPVIASDAGGSREAFVDGEHGILVQPKDEAGLAKAIATLAEDPALRLAMGNRAWQHVHAKFTRRRFADEVFAFYREIVPAESR